MATVLRLENYDASSTFDFIGSDVGLIRNSGGLRIDPNDDKTTTTFGLLFKASTAAGIREDYNDMINLLDKAKEWHTDDLQSDSIWLRWVADGETAKRSLVYDYGVTIGAGEANDPYQHINDRIMVSLAITHDSESEEIDELDWQLQPVSDDGFGIYSLYDSTTEPPGDRGSRIGALLFYAYSGYSADKVWFGIKPFDNALASYVQCVLDVEDAFALNSGTAFSTETGSHGTQVVEVDFSTGGGSDDLVWRAGLQLADYTPSYSDVMRGTYQVLLRYKLDSGSAVAVRGGVAASSSSTPSYATYNSLQYNLDDDDNWHWLELGVMKFPPRGERALNVELSPSAASVGRLQGLTVWIDVERISGSGSVFLDCVQLIPYEHHIAVDDLNAQYLTQPQPVSVLTYENGTTDAYTRLGLASSDISANGNIVALNDWRLPYSQYFLLSVAIEGVNDSILPGATAITLYDAMFYRRWAGYNGD